MSAVPPRNNEGGPTLKPCADVTETGPRAHTAPSPAVATNAVSTPTSRDVGARLQIALPEIFTGHLPVPDVTCVARGTELVCRQPKRGRRCEARLG